jgi:hypothetical protein
MPKEAPKRNIYIVTAYALFRGGVIMGVWEGLSNLVVTIVASVVLILLGIIYFMLTIWVIKVGAQFAGLALVGGDMVVLTAGIVTAAAIIGSAIQQ